MRSGELVCVLLVHFDAYLLRCEATNGVNDGLLIGRWNSRYQHKQINSDCFVVSFGDMCTYFCN